MRVEWQIAVWWVLFGGTHILGSAIPVRRLLIDRLGLPGFKAVYSVVALATFVPLCLVFFRNRHAGAVLFGFNPVAFTLAQILMFLALAVLMQGLLSPGPMTTLAEMTGRSPFEPRGVHRITRHPQNTAFALFGFAHILANPFFGDWIFFGGFVLFAIVSAVHQDRRILAFHPAVAGRFVAETSLLPFAAVLAGRQRLRWRELHLPGLAAAIVLFVILRYSHPFLFGGFGR